MQSLRVNPLPLHAIFFFEWYVHVCAPLMGKIMGWHFAASRNLPQALKGMPGTGEDDDLDETSQAELLHELQFLHK